MPLNLPGGSTLHRVRGEVVVLSTTSVFIFKKVFANAVDNADYLSVFECMLLLLLWI